MPIEPVHFVPIIPLVLANGAEGIGTGWSTSLPPHHPLELIEVLERRVTNGPDEALLWPRLKPWLRGFRGKVEFEAGEDGAIPRVLTRGHVELAADRFSAEITELPARRWTDDYRSTLETLMDDPKSPVRAFDDHNEKERVYFRVKFASAWPAGEIYELERHLKLIGTMSMTNMHLFDAHGRIKRYATAMEIVENFAAVRAACYVERKCAEEASLEVEHRRLRNQRDFTREVAAGDMRFSGSSKAELLNDLREKGYEPDPRGEIDGVRSGNVDNIKERRHEDYGYLINTPIYRLTDDEVLELERRLVEAGKALNAARRASPEERWLADLEKLRRELEKDPEFANTCRISRE